MPLDGLLLEQLLILPFATTTITILHMQCRDREGEMEKGTSSKNTSEWRFIVVFDSLTQVQLFYDTGLKAPLTALHCTVECNAQ